VLILSLFTGAGLLDQAFREQGFCVVSVGDIIYGQDIRNFHTMVDKFDGVIGGSPCQDFSGLKRNKSDYSQLMLNEYIRVVNEAQPPWWLLENVANVPTIKIDYYYYQRLDINQGWYSDTSRLRHIQFGSKFNKLLNIDRGVIDGVKKPCALATDERSFRALCDIQGLSDDFDLPDFNVSGKKKLIGNGVPLSIGRVLAKEVARLYSPGESRFNNNVGSRIFSQEQSHLFTLEQSRKLCVCGCDCGLIGRKKYYADSCRKRAQRVRDKLATNSHAKFCAQSHR
jgi:DNA (cytosine-5)-methyltransferase 1